MTSVILICYQTSARANYKDGTNGGLQPGSRQSSHDNRKSPRALAVHRSEFPFITGQWGCGTQTIMSESGQAVSRTGFRYYASPRFVCVIAIFCVFYSAFPYRRLLFVQLNQHGNGRTVGDNEHVFGCEIYACRGKPNDDKYTSER